MSASDGLSPAALTHGVGSVLHDADGRAWIDLVSGFGAVFLGHAHPALVQALQAQAARLWACGRMVVEDTAAVDAHLAALLPRGMVPAGLLSTGMEAAEYALRVAATHTGRREFVGFARSMHGKSSMTSALCWENAPLPQGELHTLPFVDRVSEAELLQRLEDALAPRRVAAVFIEPIQGSNAAHAASVAFIDQVAALCRAHGTLLVVDEILTGLHRTGPAFISATLAAPPDLLLFAKSMGNGFPVSALACTSGIERLPAALPGSTFAGNPLALAAVRATLEAMAGLPMAARVGAIEAVVRAHFEGRADDGVALRGRGALWCVELDERHDIARVTRALRDAGVLATVVGRAVRLLPAATIPEPLLRRACAALADALSPVRAGA